MGNNTVQQKGNIMSPDEEKYRDETLIPKMHEYGKGYYADKLKDFDLNLSSDEDETGGVASIDTEAGIINLDLKFIHGYRTKDEDGKPQVPSWEFITGVMKHELLHSIRKHLYLSIDLIADEMGFTPPLSPQEKAQVLQVRARANELFKHFNVANSFNFAGDADLATLYTEAEEEEFRKVGGILNSEYPEFNGVSYLDIAKMVDERGIDTEIRAAKKHYGTLNPQTGDIDVERDEDGEFVEGYNIIRTADISNISLPRLVYKADMNILAKHGYINKSSTIMWMADKAPSSEPKSNLKVATFNLQYNDVNYLEINRFATVFPVIDVWTLDSYDEKVVEFNVAGEIFIRLPHHPGKLIAKNRITDPNTGKFMIQFNKRGGSGNNYSNSYVKNVLEDYLKTLKSKDTRGVQK